MCMCDRPISHMVINNQLKIIKKTIKMKKFFLLTVLLISLLGFNNQVKADRIPIYLATPSQTYNTCQNINNPDTFLIIKNQYFGSTMWYVEWLPQGTADTFQFIPQGSGTYLISSVWQTNQYSVLMNVFTAPPAHATINLSSGSTGHINTARDTVWTCGGSPVTIVSTATSGIQPIYKQWTGPGSFFSTNGTITVSLPGTYTWETGNSCGITRDSVHVINLPNVLPAISGDTLCNLPVDHTLDAGPGWDSYVWNTGATTPSIYTNVPGTFTVNVSNICTTATKTVVIEQNLYPLPDLATHSINCNVALCHDEIAILNPNPNFTYDTYTWRNPSDVVVSTATTLNVDYNLGEGQYTVAVTKGSCSTTSAVSVAYELTPQATEICVATYDPTIGKNKMVFSHDGMEAEDFVLCYKTGGQWAIIDSTPVASVPGNVYQMVDNVTDPQQQSRQYTVFARHACGHLSPLGDWHKTIRVAIFQDVISGAYILQVMDGYQTLSGYIPDSYTIWVDPLNDGNLTQLGILEGGNTSFTISNPVEDGAYYASVNLPWNCGNESPLFDGVAMTSPNTTTFSNKKVFNTVGIEQINATKINIFPNPSTGIFQIEGEVSQVDIFDNLGRLILSQNENTINLTNFGSGIYYAKIKTANGPAAVKLVVQ